MRAGYTQERKSSRAALVPSCALRYGPSHAYRVWFLGQIGPALLCSPPPRQLEPERVMSPGVRALPIPSVCSGLRSRTTSRVCSWCTYPKVNLHNSGCGRERIVSLGVRRVDSAVGG